jgi:hypothetical protein
MQITKHPPSSFRDSINKKIILVLKKTYDGSPHLRIFPPFTSSIHQIRKMGKKMTK